MIFNEISNDIKLHKLETQLIHKLKKNYKVFYFLKFL
jgi:hypothetical protein